MAKDGKKKIIRVLFVLTCACMVWPGLALATKSEDLVVEQPSGKIQ